MSTENLPFYRGERNFRRFEKTVALIVSNHPGVVILDHTNSGLSFRTYVCRLRDAISSYRKFNWKSDFIKPADCQVAADIVVTDDGETIRAGSAEALKEFKKSPPMESVVARIKQSIDPLDATKVDPKVICLLAAKRLLTQPIPFVNLSDEQVAWLEDNFDIAITKQTNEIYLIE